MGLEEVKQLGKAAGREAVTAADARAFLVMDGLGEALLGEPLVRDLERLLEADGPAQAMPAELQEDLVSDVVVRAEEQFGGSPKGCATGGECRPAPGPRAPLRSRSC